jgi:hypothetical protein
MRILLQQQDYCCRDVNCHNACTTNANCNILPTSAGATGHTLNPTMAIIITISMANASSKSSATTVVKATTSTTTKKSTPGCNDKGFKLCHLHGNEANHLCNECHANLLNQAGKQQQQLANSNQKNKAVVAQAPCVRCVMIAGQAANRVDWQSQWHHPQ